MREEGIEYQASGVKLKGYLVYDPQIKGRRPVVIVAHAWLGQDSFARQKAKQLAELGYAGFAADVYGNGVLADTDEKAASLMLPLFKDRQTLRNRIVAAYNTVCSLEVSDARHIGAIGFCFGGLTAIELLRSGVNIRGIVSFHGLLGYHLGENKAAPVPIADKILGSALILHGHDDPMSSFHDVQQLQDEFTKANVDWQFHVYGHALHSFTVPEMHDYKGGRAYNEKADKRSWVSMTNFFSEVFKKG